ncbi:uncharacterized protein BCR38DRAFT_468649 [Pseudomassariella vexata]|uniref:Short chain dehydrogenase n=1 Tax=Pseudomassariella vexata TaxID=1141098 RepID=A0A1Y2DGW9_9PEZI|nr:uncharacterized protein BCR38DRAFT_468649 [Pseudomassariella vexata]ORY58376.1 hypothetical protein BCR38DRAFT_468649 [Pseudomassariella vexata]
MPSYLITGASRGLGFEFLRQLSDRSDSIVVGLVRDKQVVDQKIASVLQGNNIHTVEADLTDYSSLKRAVETVSKLTGGTLDYVFANGAYINDEYSYVTASKMAFDPVEMENELMSLFKTNVIGNMHLFSLVMPLVLNGDTKKIVAISSGLADLDLISSAQYRRDGVLLMSICPGVVNIKENNGVSADQLEAMNDLATKFMECKPDWNGPSTPQAAVTSVLEVAEKASIETGFPGSFVSHHGNKQWL